MKLWITQIHALDPVDGSYKQWSGPKVPGETSEEAIEYCRNNGFGYCEVIGEWVEDIPYTDPTDTTFDVNFNYELTSDN
jgi:hypothetical protein